MLITMHKLMRKDTRYLSRGGIRRLRLRTIPDVREREVDLLVVFVSEARGVGDAVEVVQGYRDGAGGWDVGVEASEGCVEGVAVCAIWRGVEVLEYGF